MIKKYILDLCGKFKRSSILSKILISLFVFVYAFFFAISVIPSNYVITTPGAITNTINSVTVNTTNSRGYICTVGVYEYIRPSILQSWIAKAENEMKIVEYDPENDLDDEADTQYGVISKKVSINNALIIAYEKAKEKNPEINIIKNYEGVIVSAIFPDAKTDLKADDIIVKVNGHNFNDLSEFRDLTFYNATVNTNIKFNIKRQVNGEYKDMEVNCTVIESTNSNNQKTLSLGISVLDYYTVDGKNSSPTFEIVDTYSSIGSSGGSLLTLSIYNALIEEDITKITVNGENKQLLITGTGTIDLNGNIGKIGGAKQKVLTAYLNGANVFFVGSSDYDEAISALDEYNIDKNKINIIKVSTFDDMLTALESMGD